MRKLMFSLLIILLTSFNNYSQFRIFADGGLRYGFFSTNSFHNINQLLIYDHSLGFTTNIGCTYEIKNHFLLLSFAYSHCQVKGTVYDSIYTPTEGFDALRHEFKSGENYYEINLKYGYSIKYGKNLKISTIPYVGWVQNANLLFHLNKLKNHSNIGAVSFGLRQRLSCVFFDLSYSRYFDKFKSNVFNLSIGYVYTFKKKKHPK